MRQDSEWQRAYFEGSLDNYPNNNAWYVVDAPIDWDGEGWNPTRLLDW